MSTSSIGLADAMARNSRYPNIGTTNASAGNSNLGIDENASGVSWAAVIAGAVVAAALSLSLLALGAGLGFSAISPWSGEGTSASSLGAASIVWLIGMQVIAAAMGGYLAGRLRTKWTGLHTDEVFFRDTAHGFLVWAVGLVITASLLASAASTLVGGVAKAGAAAVGGAGDVRAGLNGVSNYFADTLLRPDRRSDGSAAAPTAATTTATAATDMNLSATRDEVLRIMMNSKSEMTQADKTYLSQLIASRTGVTSAAAELRVNNMLVQTKAIELEAKAAADAARKAAAKLSLWMFIGLLVGAFCASYAAMIGGRQRDL
jgi:hypothetical protein